MSHIDNASSIENIPVRSLKHSHNLNFPSKTDIQTETAWPTSRSSTPVELSKPRSPYMQVARVKTSEFAFIAGQVSVDASGTLIGHDDFEAQCAQVFANIHAALRSVGADWKNIVEFTSYLVRSEDAPAFVAYRRRAFSAMFPDGAYPPSSEIGAVREHR